MNTAHANQASLSAVWLSGATGGRSRGLQTVVKLFRLEETVQFEVPR